MEKLKLKHQLFIGKVIDEIGAEKTTKLLKDVNKAFTDVKNNSRYNMSKDQPSQIDCRINECKFHKDGCCVNVSPAITFDKNNVTCWSMLIE